jgi:hypothetical protein
MKQRKHIYIKFYKIKLPLTRLHFCLQRISHLLILLGNKSHTYPRLLRELIKNASVGGLFR